jgi:hypothetical protein
VPVARQVARFTVGPVLDAPPKHPAATDATASDQSHDPTLSLPSARNTTPGRTTITAIAERGGDGGQHADLLILVKLQQP